MVVGGMFLGGDVTRASGCDVVRLKVVVLSRLRGLRGGLCDGLKCHAASSVRNVAAAGDSTFAHVHVDTPAHLLILRA
jgi:hypothetical protein